MSKHSGGGRHGMPERPQPQPQPQELTGPIWTALPGWGIVADLMPPEVLAQRRVHVIRRRVSVAMAGVLGVCVLGLVFGMFQKHQASENLADVQAQTSQLLVKQNNYADVVRIQADVAQVEQQLPVLLADDVSHAALLEQLRAKLPDSMAINQLEITVDTGKSAATGGAQASDTASLDASGQKHIGTVTIGGTGRTLADLATYVDALRTVPGVVEPYPLSNKAAAPGTQFSLQLTLTDVLLTKKYDPSTKGGN
ncbi:hypothetical protein [Rhodococcus sp. X156]|uniref:hypothetical protein n=1 Tax=Rhodococcus sp. X156 TaxID=2499145 RepID=UPI000FDA5331|nr:hypothetical protein [Rhodococcus sp. X156]